MVVSHIKVPRITKRLLMGRCNSISLSGSRSRCEKVNLNRKPYWRKAARSTAKTFLYHIPSQLVRAWSQLLCHGIIVKARREEVWSSVVRYLEIGLRQSCQRVNIKTQSTCRTPLCQSASARTRGVRKPQEPQDKRQVILTRSVAAMQRQLRTSSTSRQTSLVSLRVPQESSNTKDTDVPMQVTE